MTLKFGKYKGLQFESAPKSYQNWLLAQDWFKMPKQEKNLHHQLNGWDGYSRKGEAIYDAIFEQEKTESDRHYCGCGTMKQTNEKFCGRSCIAEYPIF